MGWFRRPGPGPGGQRRAGVLQALASSGNAFSGRELALLREANADGGISLRFFDAKGAPVASPLDDRVIGIRLEQLKAPACSRGPDPQPILRR